MEIPTVLRTGRFRWVAGIAVGLLLILLAGVVVELNSRSYAAPGPAPVPAQLRPVIIDAATSCRAMNPSRLAGQIMEQSGFSSADTTTNNRGGRGLGGLTDAEWLMWRPNAAADRLDPVANIHALAHLTCDLVGQIRLTKVKGDPWVLAVAAFQTDLASVTAASGVPTAATEPVDRILAFAAWYAQLVDLQNPPANTPPAAPSATTVPTPSPTPTPTPTPSPTATPTKTPTAPPAKPPTASTTAPRVPTPTRTTARPTYPQAPPPPPPAPLTAGALVNQEFGCLSATAALDGTYLSVARCDGSLVQRWEATADGRIHSVGLCMDAANGATADWTRVQVAYCSVNPAQLFTLRSDRHLYSPYASKCVNVDMGTSVVLFGCLNQPNQIFRFEAQ